MAFVESKYRRVGGRFASKLGATASTDRRERLKIKQRQKQKLIGNGLRKNDKAGRKKLALGKRVVTRLEIRSNKRALKRAKGRRTRS